MVQRNAFVSLIRVIPEDVKFYFDKFLNNINVNRPVKMINFAIFIIFR